MKFISILRRIEKMDKLISQRKTGTPMEFARLLQISRSQLYNHIEMLRDYGAPIIYNKDSKSFQYEREFKISVDFSIQFISEEETIDINAGNMLKNYRRPMKLDAAPISLRSLFNFKHLDLW